jgi:hypothetical protein
MDAGDSGFQFDGGIMPSPESVGSGKWAKPWRRVMRLVDETQTHF